MRKSDSRDALERNLDILLSRALDGEARPSAAARRMAWRRVTAEAGVVRAAGARTASPSDRVLGVFAAGLVALVGAGAASLAAGLAVGPFSDIITVLVVLNIAAIPAAGLAIVVSRRHRYAEA
jgi:hypothetical protein